VLIASPEGSGTEFGNGFLALGPSLVYAGYKGTPTGGVLSATKAGADVTCIACDEGEPRELVTDDASVYWTDPGSGELRKAALGGGTVTTLWSGTIGSPVLVDASSIYWFDDGSQRIMCADRSGNDPHPVVTGQAQVTSLAIDAGFLYWTTAGNVLAKDLSSADSPFALASGRSHPRSVVADDTNVYWAEGVWDQPDNLIAFAPSGGGTVESLTSAGDASVFWITLDDTHVYASDNYGGTVWKVAKAGGEIEVLAEDQPYPFDIEVDGAAVYWSSETTAELFRVAK